MSEGLFGGLGNLLFGDDTDENMSKAFGNAQQQIAAYRPEAMQARLNMLRRSMGAFAPVNDQLARMYGTASTIPVDQMLPAQGDVAGLLNPGAAFAKPPLRSPGGG